jgi:drug/metabolite transporter (DMT)-like permease
VGDLSLVYPLARGTGPALAMLLAVLLLGKRPSWLVVGGGVFALAGGAFDRRSSTRGAIAYGLATGVVIAVYTLMGTQWLAEGEDRRRIPGAVAIVAGLVALSVG